MGKRKSNSRIEKRKSQANKAKNMLFNIFKAEACKQEPKMIRVYSFRPLSHYLYNELIFSYLSCSPVSSFNDPLDCPLFLVLTIGKNIAEAYDLNVARYEETYNAAKNLKIRCFVSESNEEKVATNTLMWAHYADSHKGILLCYEIPNVLENNNNRISFFNKVNYSDSFHGVRSNTLGDVILSRDLISMVSTKNKAWEYENEIRLLHFSRQPENEYPEIKIEKKYLKKIYFGACADAIHKMRIELFTRHYPDLQLFDTRMDPDNPLQLKNFPHIIPKNNPLDDVYIRHDVSDDEEEDKIYHEEKDKKLWPVYVETAFKSEVDDFILATNSLEEALLEYDRLPIIRKRYLIGYVLLFHKDKSKLTWEPNSMDEVHTLVKEIIRVYYESRRNIHTVREYLGISEKYLKRAELD